MVAVPKATPAFLRDVVSQLEPYQVSIKTLPGAKELQAGESTLSQIRNICLQLLPHTVEYTHCLPKPFTCLISKHILTVKTLRPEHRGSNRGRSRAAVRRSSVLAVGLRTHLTSTSILTQQKTIEDDGLEACLRRGSLHPVNVGAGASKLHGPRETERRHAQSLGQRRAGHASSAIRSAVGDRQTCPRKRRKPRPSDNDFWARRTGDSKSRSSHDGATVVGCLARATRASAAPAS